MSERKSFLQSSNSILNNLLSDPVLNNLPENQKFHLVEYVKQIQLYIDELKSINAKLQAKIVKLEITNLSIMNKNKEVIKQCAVLKKELDEALTPVFKNYTGKK